MAQGHDHLRRVGVADLHIDILVILALNHLQAQSRAQFLDPGQLGSLAIVLIIVGIGIGNSKRILCGDRASRITFIGNGVIAGAGGQRTHQGIGIIAAITCDHVAHVARQIFHCLVDLFPLRVSDGDLIGHLGLKFARGRLPGVTLSCFGR